MIFQYNLSTDQNSKMLHSLQSNFSSWLQCEKNQIAELPKWIQILFEMDFKSYHKDNLNNNRLKASPVL